MVYRRGRGLGENEEQDEIKKMKSIVVEEQEEEEQEEGSETRFVDLDEDTLLNVLERVDSVTLGRAACVNKLWCRVARDDRLCDQIIIRYMAGIGWLSERMGVYVISVARGLVESEEQEENKKMKSIVVEEQEQEEGRESGFVDLDQDTLSNVLGRVDSVTLGRAECVNKLWRKVAWGDLLWAPVVVRLLAAIGGLRYIYTYRNMFGLRAFRRHISRRLSDVEKPHRIFIRSTSRRR